MEDKQKHTLWALPNATDATNMAAKSIFSQSTAFPTERKKFILLQQIAISKKTLLQNADVVKWIIQLLLSY